MVKSSDRMKGNRGVFLRVANNRPIYLRSDLSRVVIGEVHHVGSGCHAVGMKRPDASDISLSKV